MQNKDVKLIRFELKENELLSYENRKKFPKLVAYSRVVGVHGQLVEIMIERLL